MREGLAIVSVPSGYYPWIRVGWLRRLEGDEWAMTGARCIRRFNDDAEHGLSVLAAQGAAADTELQPASEEDEPVHRVLNSRTVMCDVKAWAKACPMPKGWAPRDE